MKSQIEDSFQYLINCKDTDNLIIKGHILTEHSLDIFIEASSVEKSDQIFKFAYSNKIEIAQILGLFKTHRVLKEDLKLLNKLRNSIAHNLDYDKSTYEELVKSFERLKGNLKDQKSKNFSDTELIIFEISYGRFKAENDHMKFILLICYICGQINGASER